MIEKAHDWYFFYSVYNFLQYTDIDRHFPKKMFATGLHKKPLICDTGVYYNINIITIFHIHQLKFQLEQVIKGKHVP